MVSSMGLRWGFDTGTHQWNTAQERKKTRTMTKTNTKTMVSSMGLRWGFDTGTQMENTAQEGKS